MAVSYIINHLFHLQFRRLHVEPYTQCCYCWYCQTGYSLESPTDSNSWPSCSPLAGVADPHRQELWWNDRLVYNFRMKASWRSSPR
jgi:hypothetical protein